MGTKKTETAAAGAAQLSDEMKAQLVEEYAAHIESLEITCPVHGLMPRLQVTIRAESGALELRGEDPCCLAGARARDEALGDAS